MALTSKDKKSRRSLSTIIVLIILILLWVIISKCQDNTSTPPPAPPKPAIAKPVDKFSQMTGTEHLAEAKKALADGYKPNKDMLKAEWGRVNDAQKHLSAINKDDPASIEAQKLMTEVDRRNKEIKKKLIEIERVAAIKVRERLADALEENYLKKGLDVRIITSGPDKKNVRLKYILFSRPMVYKITTEGDLLSSLKLVGFQKVVFDDTHTYTWTYDLK